MPRTDVFTGSFLGSMLVWGVQKQSQIGAMSLYVTSVYGIMENKMETTMVYWGYIGVMEKKMETTMVYWGYIGIVEKKMEATVVSIGVI